VLFGVAAASPAAACGEKFLVPGGTIDAQCVTAPTRMLSILIYGTGTSAATAALARKDVVSTLEGVGHKVTICKNADECRDAITAGGYDLVLVDAVTARDLRAGAPSHAGKHATVVVPVINTRSRAEVATAKHEFGRVVNAEDDGLVILPALDRAARASH
jgi:hypothetical protein